MNPEFTDTHRTPLVDQDALERILSAAFQNQQYADWLRGLDSHPTHSPHPQRVFAPESRTAPAGARAAVALMAGMELQSPAAPISASLRERARQAITWLNEHRSQPVQLGRQLAAHRGMFYLLFAAALLGSLLWRIASDDPSLANHVTAYFKSNSQAALIQLGLEAPPASAKSIKPDIRVWVDFPSSTYYCPGARRYGKTRDGKFTTESNARLSQYEPASHKACE